MTLSKTVKRFCMRLRTTSGKSQGKETAFDRSSGGQSTGKRRTLTRKQTVELIFDECSGCSKMSAIPQGAFAARKVRENQNRTWLISNMKASDNENEQKGNQNSYNNKPINQSIELTPLKYNSKLMNSIWGLYNRYSVHNFKKNTDASAEGLSAAWGALAPQASTMADSDTSRALMP